MPNTCKWAKTALFDLKHIKNSIAQDDPRAATNMILRIVYATEKQLMQFPGIGRAGRVYGTKELVIAPYLIAYRILNGSDVEVLAVLHEAQAWPYHF